MNTPATPWGQAETEETIADGITFYSTISHGGFHVAPELMARIPAKHVAYAKRWSQGWSFEDGGWFEEDFAWAALPLAFPEYFKPDQIEYAKKLSVYLERA